MPITRSSNRMDASEQEDNSISQVNSLPPFHTSQSVFHACKSCMSIFVKPSMHSLCRSCNKKMMQKIVEEELAIELRMLEVRRRMLQIQRLRKDSEEHRLRAKQAKENLECFLLRHPKIHSTLSYHRVDQILSDAQEWKVVPDKDRREVLHYVMQEISKREREEAIALRQRNIKVFSEILGGLPKLTYRTTWSNAQQMLLENIRYTEDLELQGFDKEDALVCFEKHICILEQEHDEAKERERCKQKTLQRNYSEAFIVLLDELPEQNLLSPTSVSKDFYSIISRDDRFHKILVQRGSTPLDLFKFDVEARYPVEKRLIKEILKGCRFNVDLSTTLEDLSTVINRDERSKSVKDGNLRITSDGLLNKAKCRKRERQREDARRLRTLEQTLCDMLSSASFIRPDTSRNEVRNRFNDHTAFRLLLPDFERIRVFKDFSMSLDTAAQADAEESGRNREDKRRREEHSASTELTENFRDKHKRRAPPGLARVRFELAYNHYKGY